ncbi:SLC13 family permease [Luteimonas vadosa]|uniref:SLC13 family permease n=1 Tax=Luteimonas vadosa TaxID=1165507 RepID=A0ABP9DRB4_9GAMM
MIELWLTLMVMAGTVYLFVTDKLPVDVVALLVLSSLLVLGLVSPREALSGFSSQATITVAAMFVLSAGLQRSGALRAVGEQLARIRWRWLFALVMMMLVGSISAFVNNTAAVAVFLPLVIAATTANGWAPSRFLIPLSFAAQFGGVCTLVGTSTNLLVDSLARQTGRTGFTIFEFAPLGILFVVVGIAYLMIARSFLLPELGVARPDKDDHAGRYVAELVVPEQSPAIGKRGSEVVPVDFDGVFMLEILRGRRLLPSPRGSTVEEGDRLLVRGEWNRIQSFRRKMKLAHDRVASDLDGDIGTERLHAEVMVSPGSHLVNKSIKSVRFGHTYRARVHGIHRHMTVRQPLDEVPLAVGDVLLIDAPETAIEDLRADRGLIVLGKRPQEQVDTRRAATALAMLVLAIGTAALGWLPIVASALLGCVGLVLFRCLEPEEAYAAIDWRVVMLLAGVLPLGLALQNSGGADWVAQHAIGVFGQYGPVATLAAIYLLTAVMTEVMSNNAAAVLVVPIAIAAAEGLGVDAKPMLVAVAFAASTSFATPIGYQTNTMVYTAGGYRFTDFTRIGLPLNFIFWMMAIVLIPRYFPF